MPEISIIVPVYNTGQYLEECIRSITEQSFKDFECILVNDGSSDNSGEICDRYALQDTRIKVIHKENGGVSSARNTGLEYATGTYVQFVDSDDHIDKNMSKSLIKMVKQYNKSLALCGYTLVYKDYTKECIDPFSGGLCIFERQQFMGNLGYFLCELNYTNPLWNKLYKLDLMKQNNIRFIDDISYGEDLLFNLAYFNKCDGAVIMFESLYHYMIRNDNTSLETCFKRNMYENQTLLYESIKQILIENNVFYAKNRSYLATYFVQRIIYCLRMLYHKDSDYTYHERLNIIQDIVDDQNVQSAYQDNLWPLTGRMELLASFIQHKNINAIETLFIEEFKETVREKIRREIREEKRRKSKILRSLDYAGTYGIKATIRKIISKIFEKFI